MTPKDKAERLELSDEEIVRESALKAADSVSYSGMVEFGVVMAKWYRSRIRGLRSVDLESFGAALISWHLIGRATEQKESARNINAERMVQAFLQSPEFEKFLNNRSHETKKR